MFRWSLYTKLVLIPELEMYRRPNDGNLFRNPKNEGSSCDATGHLSHLFSDEKKNTLFNLQFFNACFCTLWHSCSFHKDPAHIFHYLFFYFLALIIRNFFHNINETLTGTIKDITMENIFRNHSWKFKRNFFVHFKFYFSFYK